MMVPYYKVEYVVDAKLPALSDDAQSWFAEPVVQADTDAMKKLAYALGVTGEVKKQKADIGGGYLVGPSDGSAPSVTFPAPMKDGRGDTYATWYYTGTYPKVGFEVTSETVSGSSDIPAETVVERSSEPVKPENLPDVAETRRLVKKILSSMNIDVTEKNVEATSDEFSSYAMAWQTFGGVRSPLTWNFGFGANSELSYASGSMLSFSKGPKYPRVGSDAGVKRLGDPRYFGGYGSFQPLSRMTSEPIQSVEPETVQTIHITAVKEALMPVVDTDNKVWLLPSYEFETKEGYPVGVLAIDDKFIDQGTASTTPGDSPTDSGTSITEPGVIEPGIVEPGVPDSVPTDDDVQALVGNSEAEAVKIIESWGWTVRIGERDGEKFMLTMDYSSTRVTLSITRGKVTAAVIG